MSWSNTSVYLVLLEELLVLEHVSHSGGDGHVSPHLLSFASVSNDLVEFILGGLRDLADHLVGGLELAARTGLMTL